MAIILPSIIRKNFMLEFLNWIWIKYWISKNANGIFSQAIFAVVLIKWNFAILRYLLSTFTATTLLSPMPRMIPGRMLE